MSGRLNRGRVLVTGSEGYLGRSVGSRLASEGFDVRGFDLARGDDVLYLPGVLRAADGCSAIVHLAAIPHDDAGTPEAITATNVLGTWHVLLAARAVRAERVVHLSSAMALGIFQSRVLPDVLPIDDDHAARPVSPYSVSKWLGEILCANVSADDGPLTVCLRSTRIVGADDRAQVGAEVEASVAARDPICDYAAWIDLRDVADAVHRALTAPLSGHVTCLLAADDTVAAISPQVLAAEVYRTVPWEDDTTAESLVRTTRARTELGWAPRHRWATEEEPAV